MRSDGIYCLFADVNIVARIYLPLRYHDILHTF